MTVTPEDLARAYGELGVDDSWSNEAIADVLAARVHQAMPELLAAIADDRRDAVSATVALLDAADVLARRAPAAVTEDTDAESSPGTGKRTPRKRKTATKQKAPNKPLEWPVLPSEAQARELLAAWAATARLVDAETFDGDLTLTDATVCRAKVVRLIESRSEGPTTVPGEPLRLGDTYRNSIALVERKAPTTFKAQRWDLVMEGTISTYRCPSGCADGKQRCQRCGGRGMNPCSTSMRCGRCGGSGAQMTYSNGQSMQTRCTNCAGRGQVRCSKCGGTGQTQCWSCRAQGWTTCKTCAGTGALTDFTKGTIDRRLDEVEFETTPPLEIKLSKQAIWSQHGPYPGMESPEELPQEVAAQLTSELTKRPHGELLRKVVVETLPIVSVSYTHRGEARTAYLVGPERVVQARGVRRLRIPAIVRIPRWLRRFGLRRFAIILTALTVAGAGIASIVAGYVPAPRAVRSVLGLPLELNGSGFRTQNGAISCGVQARVDPPKLTCFVWQRHRKVSLPHSGRPSDETASASPGLWSSTDDSTWASAATGVLETNGTWTKSGFRCKRTEQARIWQIECSNTNGYKLDMRGSSRMATTLFVQAPGEAPAEWVAAGEAGTG